MACIGCGRGFHDECMVGDCTNCHSDQDMLVKNTGHSHGGMGQPTKNPEDVTDKFSTGRKRAAQLYPLFREQACEWQGKKNCGGGKPIVGCIDGKQSNRHHGPVKNTLRNEPGNVHRICTNCHARWHATNDPTYSETEYNKLPHSPEDAEEMELLANEAYWKMKK